MTTLEAVLERIVAVAKPDVILFGSAAHAILEGLDVLWSHDDAATPRRKKGPGARSSRNKAPRSYHSR